MKVIRYQAKKSHVIEPLILVDSETYVNTITLPNSIDLDLYQVFIRSREKKPPARAETTTKSIRGIQK